MMHNDIQKYTFVFIYHFVRDHSVVRFSAHIVVGIVEIVHSSVLFSKSKKQRSTAVRSTSAHRSATQHHYLFEERKDVHSLLYTDVNEEQC